MTTAAADFGGLRVDYTHPGNTVLYHGLTARQASDVGRASLSRGGVAGLAHPVCRPETCDACALVSPAGWDPLRVAPDYRRIGPS